MSGAEAASVNGGTERDQEEPELQRDSRELPPGPMWRGAGLIAPF